VNWYLEVLKKYAVFSGRARRKEYWMFCLFNISIVFVFGFIEGFVGGSGIISTFYSLTVLIPSIAVSIRRLHDISRSGWWLLIGLIPIIGAIVLLVFMVQDSQPAKNQYGKNPKTPDKASYPITSDKLLGSYIITPNNASPKMPDKLLVSYIIMPDNASVSSPITEDTLPRAYSGTLKWVDNSFVEYASIDIKKVWRGSENDLIAEGTVTYKNNTEDDTKFDVKIGIIPDTLRFEMREEYSESRFRYAEGDYAGKISRDLKTINVIWTTKSSGRQGKLILGAK
jgi:uncharacterized membrane protein YhaH (DUF805 family)